MQFIDEAVIHVKAGDGGNGSAAFRREDGVPRGGPSGGDGGNGGSIVFVADPQLSSLLDYKFRRHYAAERGEDGRNKDQYGAAGEDLVLRVPVGTVVLIHDPAAHQGAAGADGDGDGDDGDDDEYADGEAAPVAASEGGGKGDADAAGDGEADADGFAAHEADDDDDEGDGDDGDGDEVDEDGDEAGGDGDEAAAGAHAHDDTSGGAATRGAAAQRSRRAVRPRPPRGELLADLADPGARFVVARGGIGGRGNIHFKTPWNQAPRTAEPGTLGEERTIRLELKLLADVGLLGYPNVGKSTFISRVSRARPKIADYPFTTLVPNLGVVQLSDERHFVIADIPGLIEGASQGAGLGHQFLRHVERCRVLLHIVEATFTTGPDRAPLRDFDVINSELAGYSQVLAGKPQVVVLNKIDAMASDEVSMHQRAFRDRGIELLTVSAATGAGIDRVLELLWSHLHPSPRAR